MAIPHTIGVALRVILRGTPLCLSDIAERLRGLRWSVEPNEELVEALRRHGAHESVGLWFVSEARQGTALPRRSATPNRRATLLREILDAIREERNQAERDLSGRILELWEGAILGTTARSTVVRFKLRGARVNSGDNSPALLTVAGAKLGARIVSSDEASVTLAVDDPLPQDLRRARLVIDPVFLLVELEKRFRVLADAPQVQFSWEAAHAVLSLPAEGPDVEPSSTRWHADLNDDQRRALGAALGGPTYIWGPPGTGKTTTVAAVVCALLDDSKSVLLVSNTNAAVDIAMLRVLRMFAEQPYRQGELLRVGDTASQQLRTWPHGRVTLAELAAAQSAPLEARRDELAREGESLRNERTSIQTDYRRLQREIADLRRASYVAGGERASQALHQQSLSSIRRQVAERGVEEKRITVRIAAVQDETALIDEQLSDVRRQLIGAARFVACTAYAAYTTPVKDRRFDVVVVDEASMLNLPLAMHAAGLGSGHTVFAGDFRQLSPISHARSEAVRKWMRSSVFEATGISESRVPAGLPGVVALRQQHRMRSPIAKAISDSFYRDLGLITPEDVDQRALDASLEAFLPEAALWLVDTSALSAGEHRANGTISRANLCHAVIVAALLESFPEVDVGLIAPFGPQVQLLQAASLARGTVDSATVHRFQGGERSVILFDTTEAAGLTLHPWFRATRPSDEGSRLVNVAVSRARDRVILLADLAYLKQGIRTADTVGYLLERFARSAARLGVSEVVRSSRSVVAFQGDEATACIRRDIQAVSTRLVMSAPKPRPEILADLIPLLRDACTRGVDVSLRLTHGQRDVTDAVASLRSVGGRVTYATGIEIPNVLLVDDLVVWTRGPSLLGPAGSPTLTLRAMHEPLARTIMQQIAWKRSKNEPPVSSVSETALCPRCADAMERYFTSDGFGRRSAIDFCRTCVVGGSPSNREIAPGTDELNSRAEALVRSYVTPRVPAGICPSCGGPLMSCAC